MQKNKIINKYSVWGATIAFLCTSLMWIIGWFIFNHSTDNRKFNKNEIYQEQIDRLSHIALLSAEMSILRKEDNKVSVYDPILQEIINQIAGNVVLNSLYEFDGKSKVKFDILDSIFKKLIDKKLIDSEMLSNPFGISEDAKYHDTKITHDFYTLTDNKVKKTMTLDEYKKFQEWFYNKIMNQPKYE